MLIPCLAFRSTTPTTTTRTPTSVPANALTYKAQTLPTVAKDNIFIKGAGSYGERDLNEAKMKRHNNLFTKICSLDNLHAADAIARKGKAKQPGVIAHKSRADENISRLHKALVNKTYRTSAYKTFKIYEPKERIIFSLPYYPDRIVHHAIMQVIEPILVSTFTADTYSCIKGRGIHAAVYKLKAALKDVPGTKYCLKLDIRQFYPSVDHCILKTLLRRKFKDSDLLELLDGIIDSSPGLPIGNYLSAYFANFYLTGFDHWLKESKNVRYYFRYADDLVILSDNKADLHQLLAEIREYLQDNLNLQVKNNYQVFPIAARGIDVLGYVFYHDRILLRKSTKQRFIRMLKRRPNLASLAAYKGWTDHCNSRHLLKTLNVNQIKTTVQ